MRFFISRPLRENSPLRLHLPQLSWMDVSLLRFELVPLDREIGVSDYLFFYSRKGVEFLLRQVMPNTLPDSFIAAYGPGTADELIGRGLIPNFVGTGEAYSTAQNWMKSGHGSTDVLFVQGKQSRESLKPWFSPYQSIAVYDQLKSPRAVGPCQGYVFTSPMNVESFFEMNDLDRRAPIFAIGETTKSCLTNFVDESRIILPDESSESGLARAVAAHLSA